MATRCCNLHGACGGKGSSYPRNSGIYFVAICTERVEAKQKPEAESPELAVAICTGRVEDLASSPEKNPRKFMQTYCIFIHLGV